MAINLVEYPNTSAPVENTDWTDMYALVAANGVPQAPRLTDWASVSAAPSLAQGAFILHEGSYYQVQAADETISGSPASGINYIVMSLSGSVLSASWTNSLTGYTYDPAYGAMYNTARDMLLTEVCYLDGSDYIRGRGLEPTFKQWITANGLTSFDGNFFVGGSVITDRIASLGDTVEIDDDLEVTGGLAVDGSFIPPLASFTTEGSQSIASGSSWTVPRGIYTIGGLRRNESGTDYDTWLECQLGGSWNRMDTLDPGSVTGLAMSWAYQVISDGTNYRVSNQHDGGSSRTIYWRKH